MKQLLSLLALIVVLSACGEHNLYEPPTPEPEPEPNPELKEYTVSFGFAGEITSIEEMPLLRAVTNDVYGIQIYSKPENGGDYTYYAFGLFDDKNKMSVNLLEGYKYKFACSVIKDGKTKWNNSFFIYGDNSAYGKIDNKFYIANSRYLRELDNVSTISWAVGKSYKRVPIDRYYGEFQDYTPQENGKVSISMKRVVFGVKFQIENFTDGTIDINIKDAPTLQIVQSVSSSIEQILTLANQYPYGLTWTGDDYSETVLVSIYWNRADGVILPLASQDITFTRNKKTVVTINVNDNTLNSDVDINFEQTGEMDYTDPVYIEGGNSSGTIVDPQ